MRPVAVEGSTKRLRETIRDAKASVMQAIGDLDKAAAIVLKVRQTTGVSLMPSEQDAILLTAAIEELVDVWANWPEDIWSSRDDGHAA